MTVVCAYGVESLDLYVPGKEFVLLLRSTDDVSPYLSDLGKVRMVRADDEEAVKQVAWECLFLTVEFVPHPEAEMAYGTLRKWLNEIALFAADYRDFGVQVVRNMGRNAKHLERARDGMKLRGKFAGVPAVICGAGPSLDQHIEKLKKTDALILAGGSALSALKRHGITPHFGGCVDPDPPLARFEGMDKMPFFYQSRASADVLEKVRGQLIWMPDNGGYPIEKQWVVAEESFDGGWNVATFLMAIAHHMGCDPIILIGVDLAAQDGKVYAEGVAVPDDKVKGDWALAAEWIEAFSKKCRVLRELEGIARVSFDVLKTVSELPFVTRDKGISHNDFLRCFRLCEQMLQVAEKIFPARPFEKGEFVSLELALEEEGITRDLLEPVWAIWKPMILRQGGEEILHKLLFFQKVLAPHCECYSFEDGLVAIEDPELAISLQGHSHHELHGPSRFYSASGQLLSEAWFFDGQRQGRMRQYYTSGALCSLQCFKNDQREGVQEYYNEDGTLRTRLHFYQGHLRTALIYGPNGAIKREVCT